MPALSLPRQTALLMLHALKCATMMQVVVVLAGGTPTSPQTDTA
jgi:hypothetical protein